MNTRKEKRFKLWQRCCVTLLILVAYRIMCAIPMPGVNRAYFSFLISANTSLGLLNTFTGNTLSSLSIMALNISPYISASIVVQLLETAFPSLKQRAKGSPAQKKVIFRITMVLTTIFALTQSLGMAMTFGKSGMLMTYNALWVSIVVATWTATSLLVAFVGKKMEDNKEFFVGRGTSLFLLTNILATFPQNIKEIYSTFFAGKENSWIYCVAGVFALFVLLTIIALIHETEKRVPLSYSTNVVYEEMSSSQKEQVLPIKLLPASVMPIIFASAILSFPVLIATFMGKDGAEWVKYFNTSYWFNPANIKYTIGCVFFVLLIVLFSFFYVEISLNPYEIAEDLQKAGGFIQGLRTNTETGKYLKKLINGMARHGAVILSVISVIPFMLSGYFGLSKMAFLGTSVLIIVAVIIETAKDISATKIAEKHTSKAGGLFSENYN